MVRFTVSVDIPLFFRIITTRLFLERDSSFSRNNLVVIYTSEQFYIYDCFILFYTNFNIFFMKKSDYFFGMILFMLFSCQENEELKTDKLSSETLQTRALGDGKYDVLGHGYNVTDKYLDGSSSKALVLDVSKLEQLKRITSAELSETTYSHYSGTDIIDFSLNMSGGVGLNFLAFVGSLNSNFKSSYKFSSDESFAFYSLEYLRASYTLSATNDVLRTCLTANFQSDIANATPAEIVNIYGTHVLAKIFTGARLEAFMKTESTIADVKGAVDAKLGITFKKLFGLSVNYSFDGSLETKTRNTELFYKTIGGTAELESGEFMDIDGTTVQQPKLNMIKWSASIPSTVPRFIKADESSFIPIYELITDPSKKLSVENYVKQYIAERQPESINNYSSSAGVRSVGFLGDHTQGAGVAFADINKNGIPDMILMGIDNPNKSNSYYYKILFDIDEYGNSNRQSQIFNLGYTNAWENAGGSIAVTDLNNNGIPDIIFAAADSPKGGNPIYYRVAFDVDQSGKAKSVSGYMTVSEMGNEYNDIGIDIYDFNKNGKPDLLIMAYDDPKGANTFRYKIGYDLDASGIVLGGYSQTYTVEGVGTYAQGAGIAVADINKNGKPDILLSALDAPSGPNKFRYKILWDVNNAGYSFGNPTTVSPTFVNMDLGDEHEGGDCAIYDINRNGSLDVVFVAMNAPAGQNSWRYITGFDFTTTGYIQTWR